MLAIETEFPHVGSTGWLKPNADRPEAEPVRILQNNPDGTRLVVRTKAYRRDASANLRVTLKQLAATFEEALPKGRRKICFDKRRLSR